MKKILIALLAVVAATLVVLVAPVYPFASDAASPDRFIAHAGGITPDGHTYTNSREAVLHSLEKGYTMIELDLYLTADSQLVCLHDLDAFAAMTDTSDLRSLTAAEFRLRRIFGQYHPVTLDEVLELRRSHPFTIVTDKFGDPAVLDRYFKDDKSLLLVEALSLDNYLQLEAAGYQALLPTDGNLRRFVTSRLKAGRPIGRIVTTAHIARDYMRLRILKRVFGIEVFFFSTGEPASYAPHIGREIDVVYADDKDLFAR